MISSKDLKQARPKIRTRTHVFLQFLVAGLATFTQQPAFPETLNIAVAANFKVTLEKLVTNEDFKFDHELKISSGSTGSLYTQIVNGAPFNVFLAADMHRPRLLEQGGLVRQGSRKTYAIGQLVLWAPGASSPVTEEYLSLFTANLAIANPKTAPYGLAALQLLANLDVSDPRIITGENVAQAYQFVHTGNAQAGLVSLSQVISQGIDPFFYWQIPQQYYEPIEQQMVILDASPASIEFTNYLISETARDAITRSGYQVPGNPHRD